MEAYAEERLRLSELRAFVESALGDLVPDAASPSRQVQAAMRYALLSPGKRIRPILALLSAEHLGCSASVAMPAACAIELVHAASLVLDDLPCMDNAESRRGLPSVHVRYGQDVAVLTGVALLNAAFDVVAKTPSISDAVRVEMVGLLARTVGTKGLVAGQESDLRGPPESSPCFLRRVHHQKTGMLFMAAAEMGALAAGAGSEDRRALRGFAKELGLAFQALDDLDDEAELDTPHKPGANMLAVLSRDDLRQEVTTRIVRAKAALVGAGDHLTGIEPYVDLLVWQAQA